MNYSCVYINSLAYELAPEMVSSRELESRLAPLYQKFRIPIGQLAALTGIEERRWWPKGFKVSQGAVCAAQKALAETGLDPKQLGALVYTGVCRDQHEPATACAVASAIGIGRDCAVFDISNACLGVLSGILDVANRIELGQIRAGMVVSCESSREIVEASIEQMLADPSMANFAASLATLTGGSGAVAVILTDGSLPLTTSRKHQLLGASQLAAPEHHQMCQWGFVEVGNRLYREVMRTDAVALLKEGVELARQTWEQFLQQRQWLAGQVDKVICHQVGAANRKQVLGALGIAEHKEFPTFARLGNMGTVSLPVSAALAHGEGFLQAGDRVSFLGIGSGLNCMMLGLRW
ncbi:3-oxoacyl-ACP synthase III [Shewanella algae]|uniref:3-oxoacyl-ACP synthase III n=1 Tax=Shewanella algae TaxID=38313 RepID=UPI001AADA754|nr:3-oxoacyl-ACP synthase III [Shewanella algae]MBO2657781.1 3-oxoacyl-ACP synthase III [Shewanella algae]